MAIAPSSLVSRRSLLVGSVAGASAWAIAGSALQHGEAHADSAKRKTESAWSDADAAVPVTSLDPMNGERLAPVTLVVFGDYQCPFCAKLEQTITGLKGKYGATVLRVIFKHFPLDMHQRAKPAALAAAAVFERGGNPAFWKFHDRLFQNGKDLTDSNFVKWAIEAGVSETSFQSALQSKSVGDRITKLLAESKALKINGTPMSFVNGIPVSGSRDQQTFEPFIDNEIASIKALAGQVKPNRIYVDRCNANFAANAAQKAANTKPKP